MTYEYQSAVWRTAQLIPASIDLEDRKKARNREAQRKYRKKLQENKRELVEESQTTGEGSQIHKTSYHENDWSFDPTTSYRKESSKYTLGEDSYDESTNMMSRNPRANGSLAWEGQLGYFSSASSASPYNSNSPLTPKSTTSAVESGFNLSPAAVYLNSHGNLQHEKYTHSPSYCYVGDALSPLDASLVQWQEQISLSTVSCQQIQEFYEVSGDPKGLLGHHYENASLKEGPPGTGGRVFKSESSGLKDHTKLRKGGSVINVSDSNKQDQDTARRKQRTHLKKKAGKVVDNFSQLYDLGVGLDLCARDPEFKRSLQTTKRRFNQLLSVEGEVEGESDLE